MTCKVCGGTGIEVVVEKGKRKEYRCSECDGKGVTTCKTCYGRGMLEYPKSTKPPVAKEVIWTGWKVRVETNPPGARISVVDMNTAQYKSVGMSNADVRWFSSSSKSYPIIVEYKEKRVGVLPYEKDGKETDNVKIDFTGSEPRVLMGRQARLEEMD